MWGISILLVPKSIHDSAGLTEGTGPGRGDSSPQGQRKSCWAVPSLRQDQGGMFAPTVPVPAKRGDSVFVTVNQAPFTRAKNALSEGKQNKNTKQNREVKNSLTFLCCESPGLAERREPPEFVKQTLSHPRPRSARCRWNAKYIFKPCSSKESVRSRSRATCMWVWPREKTRDAENISWGWETARVRAHAHTHIRTREINDNLQGRVAVRSWAGHEIPARCGTHPYQLLSHHGVGMFRLEGGQQPFCIPAHYKLCQS